MSHDKKSTNLFAESFKGLIKSTFRLTMILFAWLMKAGGTILTKTGETIERIIIKKSQ